MTIHKFAASIALSAMLAVGVATPVSSVFAAGTPYGCQINPNAAACHKPTTPAVVNGSVAAVSQGSTPASGSVAASAGGAPPVVLPTTGGAAPASSDNWFAAAALGLFLSLCGFALRRRVALRA